MTEEKSSYRQIMKATSIFGGVQVFNILISIIRSKAIAVLLGPAGMGIVGLLTSTTGLVSSLTNFGLGTSAVKDIAEAHGAGDEARIAKTAAVFKKLVWITGLLGALVTLFLSSLLSELTFGNRDYTWSFVFLSVTLLLGQLTSGQNVILQGSRKLKYLASANMAGSILSLLITLPLYYLYGSSGIVPALIIMGISTFFVAMYFGNKIEIPIVKVDIQEVVRKGKGMLKLGFMLSLSGLISSIVAYSVTIYISNTGGVEDVGLYNAGFQIISTYVGLVFTAMGTDYFPRLSAVAHDDEKSGELVNQQSEIAILILGPILLLFIFSINWVVIFLYSEKFIAINEMLRWSALGMFFKAASWPIGFIFLAKGDSGIFFKSELFANFYILILNIFGYKYFGLTGLGISFLIGYILVYFQVQLITWYKYNFKHKPSFLILFLIHFTLSVIGFILMEKENNLFFLILIIMIIILSLLISFRELNKRMSFIK